ncbi:MAG: M14 family zinc carboxypeptidase [Bdellovibrionota bacterium]
MLRKTLLSMVLLTSTGSLTQVLWAKPQLPLEEIVWVSDVELRYYPQIKEQRNFVIDHRKAKGFEVYGPRGMKAWLLEHQIPFSEPQLSNKEREDLAASYPSFEQVEAKLKGLAEKYPVQTQLITVGQSVRGKNLYFLKISKNAAQDLHLPEFKYISSMHGDEITGRELTLSLAEEILAKYGTDPQITELVDNTEIFIMPSMNPDGSEARTRWNANRSDLNRDFPDFTSDNNNSVDGREVETKAIMKFQDQRNFALSANFHGGSEVVNYPWDTTETPHPLDNLIQSLSLSYAKLVPYIFNSSEFPQGIVNGFAWYEVNGGMQDWSEHWYNDLQVTVELSNAKWPSYSQIPSFYQENKAALLQFIKNVHQGAGFYFKDSTEAGTVSIQKAGKEIGTYNFRNGEFYRVLEPGAYDFVVTGRNERSFQFSQVVVTDAVVAGGNYRELE